MALRLLLLAILLALGVSAARASEVPAQPAKNERFLTDEQRLAVLKAVRACWIPPAHLPSDAALTLLVVVNEENTVLDATIVPEDQERAESPALHKFARSALNAVTDHRCARLEIPNAGPGRDWLFRLRFTAG